MSDPLESTDELIVGNKYVVWGNQEFGDSQMYGWYDYSPGDSDGIYHCFNINKNSPMSYRFTHWDKTDGNLPRTPQNIPMPLSTPPPIPPYNPAKNEKVVALPLNDFFITKDKSVILFDLVTGICPHEKSYLKVMIVYTQQLIFELADFEEYDLFMTDYTNWRNRC